MALPHAGLMDIINIAPLGKQLKARDVVCDSNRIDTLLAIPL